MLVVLLCIINDTIKMIVRFSGNGNYSFSQLERCGRTFCLIVSFVFMFVTFGFSPLRYMA